MSVGLTLGLLIYDLTYNVAFIGIGLPIDIGIGSILDNIGANERCILNMKQLSKFIL